MEGWISLHRKIEENWIWKSREPFDRRSAWISLLLKVNHKDSKIMMNGKLLEVKKGSFITSELKLANEWKWGRKKVRIFLQSLEDDKMLSKKSTTKYTAITIENWAIYQNREQQKNSPGTAQEQHRNTDNNDNNDNNIIYKFGIPDGNQMLTKGVPSIEKNSIDKKNNICPSNEGQPSKEDILLSDFEQIWNIYPRKEGKNSAFSHYKSWIKGKKYAGKTMKLNNKQMWYAVKKYADEVKNTEKKYIKMGSSFFNEKIMDYVEVENE